MTRSDFDEPLVDRLGEESPKVEAANVLDHARTLRAKQTDMRVNVRHVYTSTRRDK